MSKRFAWPSRNRRGAASSAPAPGPDAALDPEVLERVQRFERCFAELAPTEEEEPAAPVRHADDLFPEFPDDIFEDRPQPRAAATESARVVPMPRRDHDPAAASASPAAAWPREAARDATTGDVELDEAMAILRSAEKRRRPVPEPGVDPEDKADTSALDVERLQVREPAPRQRPPESRTLPLETRVPSGSWTSRSHVVRTVAVAAAVVALAVGVAAGYVLGRTPSGSASGHIETSAGGGTHLKLERNLPQR